MPDAGRHVWGALWELDLSNLASLDNQEHVHLNLYRPLNITVETPTGETKEARVYILVDNAGPLKDSHEFTDLPSETYLRVVLTGAIESALPQDYIQWLRSSKHNGQTASKEIMDALKEKLAPLDSRTKNKDNGSVPQSPVLSNDAVSEP